MRYVSRLNKWLDIEELVEVEEPKFLETQEQWDKLHECPKCHSRNWECFDENIETLWNEEGYEDGARVIASLKCNECNCRYQVIFA